MADVSQDQGGSAPRRPVLRPFSGQRSQGQGALKPLGARRPAIATFAPPNESVAAESSPVVPIAPIELTSAPDATAASAVSALVAEPIAPATEITESFPAAPEALAADEPPSTAPTSDTYWRSEMESPADSVEATAFAEFEAVADDAPEPARARSLANAPSILESVVPADLTESTGSSDAFRPDADDSVPQASAVAPVAPIPDFEEVQEVRAESSTDSAGLLIAESQLEATDAAGGRTEESVDEEPVAVDSRETDIVINQVAVEPVETVLVGAAADVDVELELPVVESEGAAATSAFTGMDASAEASVEDAGHVDRSDVASVAGIAAQPTAEPLLDDELASFRLTPHEVLQVPSPIPGLDSMLRADAEANLSDGGTESETVLPSVVEAAASASSASAPEIVSSVRDAGELSLPASEDERDATAHEAERWGGAAAMAESDASSRAASVLEEPPELLAERDAQLQDFVARSATQQHVLEILEAVARRVRAGEIVPAAPAGSTTEAVLASVLASLLTARP